MHHQFECTVSYCDTIVYYLHVTMCQIGDASIGMTIIILIEVSNNFGSSPIIQWKLQIIDILGQRYLFLCWAVVPILKIDWQAHAPLNPEVEVIQGCGLQKVESAIFLQTHSELTQDQLK